MRYRDLAWSLGFSLAAVACASKQTPVRLVADPADATALVGEWSGEYESPQNGRSGSIEFRLEAANDTAYGEIVMLPKRAVQPATGGDPEASRGDFRGPEVIKGTFESSGSTPMHPLTKGTWKVQRTSP